MKKLIPVICLLCVHLVSCAQETSGKEKLSVAEWMKLPIKEIVNQYYKDNLYIGTANHGKLIHELSGQIAAREFDYMTPANDFKQSYIHPTYDSWRWELPDNWITYAKDNGIRLRLHSPISPQCSKWVKEDSRTPEELTRMLEEYMTQLCIRYANQPNVQWMDVVNETIAKENVTDPVFGDRKRGEWFGARQGTALWENPWTIIGSDEESEIRTPLYINKAFEIATRYTPSRVKLIINQHGNFESVVWERMKKLVNYLRGKGYRVDGLGWQAHIDTGWEKIPGNVERLDQFISWCHDNSLEFHITEMNVWIKDGDKTREAEQAETYGKIVETLLKHVERGPVGISFWNVRDEDTPNEKWMGCLWDNTGRARPGYERIKKELINHIMQ